MISTFSIPQNVFAYDCSNEKGEIIEVNGYGPDSELPANSNLNPTLTTASIREKTDDSVNIAVNYKNPSKSSKGYFIVGYRYNGRVSYFRYTMKLQIIIDENETRDLTVSGVNPTSTKTVVINIKNDQKAHNFRLKANYVRDDSQCAKDGTLSEESTIKSFLKYSSFSTESDSKTINLDNSENSKCSNLKSQIESQICTVISCQSELYKNGSYWESGTSPSDGGDTSANGFAPVTDVNLLSNSGKLKVKQCNEKIDKFQDLKKQYQEEGCLEKIIWSKRDECRYGGAQANDTEIDPQGDANTANTLDWMEGKLEKVEVLIEDIPTTTTSGKCESKCKDIIESKGGLSKTIGGFICAGVCMVSDAFIGILRWGIEFFKGSLSVETGEDVDTNYNEAINSANSEPNKPTDKKDDSGSGGDTPTPQLKITTTGTLSDI